VLAACVSAMLAYRPAAALAGVRAPISIVVAGEPAPADAGPADGIRPADRRHALDRLMTDLGPRLDRPPRVLDLVGVGHNVMRYRPAEIAEAIEGVDLPDGAYHRGT